MSRKVSHAAEGLPHSWDIEHWPVSVWPHSPKRAKYVLRAFRDELMRCGALVRIGREIIVLGKGYGYFLEQGRADVAGYANGAAVSRDAVA